MKKIMGLLFALVTAFSLYAGENERQAVYGALDSAEKSLATVNFKGKTVVVFPLIGDEWGLTERLNNMLVRQEVKCVIDRNNQEFNRLANEIHRNNRELWALDPETVVKFGRLQAAEIAVIGQVKELQILDNGKSIYTEIVLQAYELATKRYIWGGEFAKRFYVSSDLEGVVVLDDDITAVLDKALAQAGESLRNSEKLNSKRKIVVLPLAGDVDNYITTKTISMISGTKHIPVDSSIKSRSAVASFVRDGEFKDHLVCYGAVRMLHKSTPEKSRKGDQYVTSYTVTAEINLTIADPLTNEVLWICPVRISEKVESAVEAVPAKEKLQQIPEEVINDVADNWKSIIWGSIIAIIVLILVIFGIKLYFSYHRIR